MHRGGRISQLAGIFCDDPSRIRCTGIRPIIFFLSRQGQSQERYPCRDQTTRAFHHFLQNSVKLSKLYPRK
jgi:hypothetical protein